MKIKDWSDEVSAKAHRWKQPGFNSQNTWIQPACVTSQASGGGVMVWGTYGLSEDCC